MKKIYFLVALLMLGLFIGFTGCGESEKEEVISADAFSNYLSEDEYRAHVFFRDKVITVGNHHFIPLVVSGRPDEYPRQILSLLELFEKIYPDLKVTSWSIEKRQTAYITTAWIYGIWIDTQPSKNN